MFQCEALYRVPFPCHPSDRVNISVVLSDLDLLACRCLHLAALAGPDRRVRWRRRASRGDAAAPPSAAPPRSGPGAAEDPGRSLRGARRGRRSCARGTRPCHQPRPRGDGGRGSEARPAARVRGRHPFVGELVQRRPGGPVVERAPVGGRRRAATRSRASSTRSGYCSTSATRNACARSSRTPHAPTGALRASCTAPITPTSATSIPSPPASRSAGAGCPVASCSCQSLMPGRDARARA